MNPKDQATGPEVEFEPGSRGRVLRNLLGITRVRDMNAAESQALQMAQDAALDPCRPPAFHHEQKAIETLDRTDIAQRTAERFEPIIRLNGSSD